MTARRKARRPLLSSCAIAGALAVTGQAIPARAQSYLGSATTVAGTATVDQSSPGRTFVTVSGPSAVINWTPLPSQTPDANGVITFQNAGTEADFMSDGSDYTVLNRILPSGNTNPIALNGLTNSYIGSLDGGSPGGHIWFYSPGGIIVGATGAFNVGSLGLSTLDITNADFTSGVGSGLYHFQPALNDHAKISIAAGGMLTAIGTNAYIALVSPRIDMAGTARANGSIAYVAGTQADITIHADNGLFDINVTQGSPTDGTAGDATVFSHTGTSGGGAATGTGDQRAVYMVAIPKNNAITMLVGGDVGYDAASAGVVNGTVVLEGGSNVTTQSYTYGTYYNDISTPAPAVDTNIVLDSANFTSAAQIFANGTIDAHSNATNPLTAASDLLLTATRAVTLESGAGQTVNIGDNLRLSSPGLGPDAQGNATGGSASIVSNGGAITVGGGTGLEASALGDVNDETGNGGSGTGGTASVTINGGSLDTNGLYVNAEGDGGDSYDGTIGGTGTGGAASVGVSGGGTLNATILTVSAEGHGGADDVAGQGQGGQASVTADGTGSIQVGGNVRISASGNGGSGLGTSGGNAVGGSVLLETLNGGTFSANTQGGTLVLDASGQGGYDGSEGFGTIIGGSGNGGTASIMANSGSISALDTTVDVSGNGQDGSNSYGYYGISDGGNGGDGRGGSGTVQTSGGAITLGALTVDAGGFGGYGGNTYDSDSGPSMNAGNGGSAQGGSAQLIASAGSITTSSTSLLTNASGGDGGTSDSAAAGTGGNAVGGGATDPTSGAHIDLSGGSATLGPLALDASGFGGTAGTGNQGTTGAASGNGTGGLIDVAMGSNLSALPSITLTAIGQGAAAAGSDAQAIGGNGQGGTIAFTQSAGTLTTNALSLDATGQGGTAGGSSGIGGAGDGGNADATFTGGATDLSSGITLLASGVGGQGFASGGEASGGEASLLIDNAAITSGTPISIAATALGGNSPSGTGGAATGGDTSVTVRNAGSLGVLDNLSLLATASGGFGQNGGTAVGGTAKLTFTESDLSVDGDAGGTLTVDAGGSGGSGSLSGGAGTGGIASLAFDAADGAASLNINGSASFSAAGLGGNTLTSGSGTPARGPAGLGQGGSASVDVANGTASFSSLLVDAGGTGGVAQDGGTSGDGIGGTAEVSTGADGGDGGIATSALTLSAQGAGGTPYTETGYGLTFGGDGGNGTGGVATLSVAGAGISNLDVVTLLANGIGGDGGNVMAGYRAGNGGTGIGGEINLIVGGANSSRGVADITAELSGVAGNGGTLEMGYGSSNPSMGASGGDGGNAIGGTLSLTAQNGGTLDVLSVAATILATAGNGGSASGGAVAGTAGNGGDATGGTMLFASNGQGSLLTAHGAENIGPDITLNGTGGKGGDGADGSTVGNTGSAGGNGGNGVGGTFGVSTTGGVIDFGTTTFIADGAGGNAGTGGIGAGQAATPSDDGTVGAGTGGIISFDIADDEETGAFGHFSAGATTLEANGLGDGVNSIGVGGTIRIGTTSHDSAPSIRFGATPDDPTTVGDFSATTRGDGYNVAGGISISADTGTIAFARDATLEADGNIMLSGTGSGQITAGGALILDTQNTIEIDQFGTVDPEIPVIATGSLQAFAGGDFISHTTSAVSADDTITASASGNLIADDLSAANGISLVALHNLTVGSANATAPDGTVALRSGFDGEAFRSNGNTVINGTVSGASVTVDSGGTIAVNSEARILADDSISLRSGGNIDLAAGSLIGGIGSIDGGNAVTRQQEGLFRPLAVSSDSAFTRGRAQNVTISAGDIADADADGPTRAGLRADGTVDGRQIALNSGSIAVGSGALLGSGSTDMLTFTNTGGGQTFLGGDGTGAPYALSNAALSRTKANVIRVMASDSGIEDGDPAAVVQDLDLIGTAGGEEANLVGSDARFEIQTSGNARVEGAVKLASAGSGDSFLLSAGNRIDIVTPTGSIGIFDPGGALAGTIELGADTITAGSAQAIADLQSLTTIAEKDKRLGINDGEVNQGGYLQADGLIFHVRDGLFIQNSGVPQQYSGARAGFTAGFGGVTIFTSSSSDAPPIQIVINGRQSLDNGTFAVGSKLIPLLHIQGSASTTSASASFDQGSTANGCLIVATSCQFDTVMPNVVVPVQDVISTVLAPPGAQDKERGSFSVVQSLSVPVINLVNFTPYDFAPMIDEPVTGAGNDDFWLGDNGNTGGTDTDTTTTPPQTEVTPPQGNIDEQVTSTRRDEDDQKTGETPKK